MKVLIPLPTVSDEIEMHLDDLNDTLGLSVNHLVAELVEKYKRYSNTQDEYGVLYRISENLIVRAVESSTMNEDDNITVLSIIASEVLESLLKPYERILKLQPQNEEWRVISITPQAIIVNTRTLTKNVR